MERVARGLARLWLVLTVLWVAFITYYLIYVENIRYRYDPPSPEPNYFSDVPADMGMGFVVFVVAFAALVPPLLVLALGAALVWAFRGFRGTSISPLGIDKATEDKAAPRPEAASHRSTGDYYSVIDRAVSRLPDKTVEAHQALYERVRTAFSAQLRGQDPSWIKHERRTLERAIQQVESRSKWQSRSERQTYEPASTVVLIASIICFPVLWIMDCTSMSLHWVVARLPKMPKWRLPKPTKGSNQKFG